MEALEDFREDGVVEGGRRSRLAGAEAVAAGVLGDAGLACGGAGSGGFLGVDAVGLDLGGTRQWGTPLSFYCNAGVGGGEGLWMCK